MLLRMLEQGFLTARELRLRARRAAARPRRPPAAGRGHQVPLLHVVDQAAGGRPPRRRPGGRPPRVRRRPADPHHDRQRDPGRRAAGGRRLAAEHRGPARLARGDREPHRRRARDGRRRRLQRAAVQPRHAGPAPARLGDQAVHPRRGARAGGLRQLDVDVEQARDRRSEVARGLHRQQLRERLLRHHHAGARDDVLRQRRVRPGRHQGRHAQGGAARRAHGHPHPTSPRTTR